MDWTDVSHLDRAARLERAEYLAALRASLPSHRPTRRMDWTPVVAVLVSVVVVYVLACCGVTL